VTRLVPVDDLEDVPMDETPAHPTRPDPEDLDVLDQLRSVPAVRTRPSVERVSRELQHRADPDRVAPRVEGRPRVQQGRDPQAQGMTHVTMPIADLPARVLAAQLPLTAAWEKVQSKTGMPGVDGVPVRRFASTVPASLRTLEHQLASAEYAPLPLRMVEMEKKNRGRRLLLVASVRDRIAQAAVAAWLGTKWNADFDRASFAYRPGLGVQSALRYIRELHESGFRWVFDADIRACFDSIDHGRLFHKLDTWLGTSSPMVGWIKAWVAAPVWDGADVTRLACGIPQGSPLSPLLANFYLDEFDRRLRAAGVKFVRYADDFLVLARTPFDIGPARQCAQDALRDLGLELNIEKTRTTSFDQWFRFLGAEIQGDVILLPFEKKKTPLSTVFVAPVMPPAMLRAWRKGHVRWDQPFVPRPQPRYTLDPTRPCITPGQAMLSRLAGPRHILGRRPSATSEGH